MDSPGPPTATGMTRRGGGSARGEAGAGEGWGGSRRGPPHRPLKRAPHLSPQNRGPRALASRPQSTLPRLPGSRSKHPPSLSSQRTWRPQPGSVFHVLSPPQSLARCYLVGCLSRWPAPQVSGTHSRRSTPPLRPPALPPRRWGHSWMVAGLPWLSRNTPGFDGVLC